MLYILTKNIFYKWQESYVFCPYVNNEYLYMAKNLKPFSAFFENYDFVTENVMPEFEPLVQNGTVLKTEKEFFTQSRYGKIKTLRAFYYYPNGEWRMENAQVEYNPRQHSILSKQH